MAETASATRSRLATKTDFRVGMGVFALLIIATVGLMQVGFGDDSDAPHTADRSIDAGTASLAGGVLTRPEEASHRPNLSLRGPRFGTPYAPKKQER